MIRRSLLSLRIGLKTGAIFPSGRRGIRRIIRRCRRHSSWTGAFLLRVRHPERRRAGDFFIPQGLPEPQSKDLVPLFGKNYSPIDEFSLWMAHPLMLNGAGSVPFDSELSNAILTVGLVRLGPSTAARANLEG